MREAFGRDHHHPSRVIGAASWLLLPIVLWFAATLFLGGDIGKWNDDYFFLGQIDPRTGAVESYTLDRELHFWRPVYRYVATPLITVLFEHDRVLHVVSAVVYGLTCLLMYGVLRRLHLSRAAAGLAAMLMVVWPSHYEVALWNSCNFTAVATAGCLWATWLYMNWLERRGGGGRWVWLTPVAMAGIWFLVAATNEQPAAAIASLSVLGLVFVVAPPGAEAVAAIARSGGKVRALARAAVPVMTGAAGIAAYLVVQVLRYPMHVGHGTGAVVAMEELPERIAGLTQDVWTRLILRDFRSGAIGPGWMAIREHPVAGAVLAVGLLVGAVMWARACRAGRAVPETPSAWRWRALLVVFGFAWAVACWVPIARINYPASSRLFFAPACGIAIAVGALLDLAIGSPRHAVGRRVWVSAVAMVVMAGATVMMIGVQRTYQARWRADGDQARQLVALVPDPPAGAVFVPIRVADRLDGREMTLFTGRIYFSPLRSSWAGGWWLQRAYARRDVFCARASGPRLKVPLRAGRPGPVEMCAGVRGR